MPFQFQPVSGDELENFECEPIRWLWGDYLARGLITLLTSRWKAGKTTLTSVLLTQLGPGGTVAGSEVAPGRAVVVSEEPLAVWKERRRLLAFGEACKIFSRPFRGRPTMAEWVEFLTALAETKPDLVVIDTLGKFLPGNIENNAAALMDALEPLHRFTDAGTAVLLIHHPKKGGPAEELSPRGSGALTAFVDILVDLDRPRDSFVNDRRRRIRTVSRMSDAAARIIELSADHRSYALLPDPPEEDGFAVGWPILKMVLEDSDSRPTRRHILKSWPQDFAKPSQSTLNRWLEQAVRKGEAERRGSGRYHDAFKYSLPGQIFAMKDLPPVEPLNYRFARPK